jgi:hypothetical protein
VKDIRIGIRIQKATDSQGKEVWKASVPMRLVFEEDFDAGWLKDELQQFEEKYIRFIKSLRDILKQIKSTRGNGRTMLYWKLGDEIYGLMEQNKNGTLFLENIDKHLARDLGVSDRTLRRCIKFSLLYPDSSKIEPDRSFNSYVATFEGGHNSSMGKRAG